MITTQDFCRLLVTMPNTCHVLGAHQVLWLTQWKSDTNSSILCCEVDTGLQKPWKGESEYYKEMTVVVLGWR
jgi:hypothetical protein